MITSKSVLFFLALGWNFSPCCSWFVPTTKIRQPTHHNPVHGDSSFLSSGGCRFAKSPKAVDSWSNSEEVNESYGNTNQMASNHPASKVDQDDAPNFTGQLNEQLTDEELEATMGEWDERVAQMNTVTLTGRVGNDPEAKYFDDGKVVVNLRLASKRKYVSLERIALGIKSGQEETDWYGLEIWGQTAEFVVKYVEKGARIGVTGSLQVDSWIDKESGEKRERAKIIVRSLDVLESKAEADLRRSGRRGPSFYTNDDEDNDDFNPGAGSSGGFFS